MKTRFEIDSVESNHKSVKKMFYKILKSGEIDWLNVFTCIGDKLQRLSGSSNRLSCNSSASDCYSCCENIDRACFHIFGCFFICLSLGGDSVVWMSLLIDVVRRYRGWSLKILNVKGVFVNFRKKTWLEM